MLDLLFWAMWFSLIIAGVIIIAQRNEINELRQQTENLKPPF